MLVFFVKGENNCGTINKSISALRRTCGLLPLFLCRTAIHMLQHNNWFYIVDGVNPVKRWNPVDGLKTLGDLPQPSVAPIVTLEAIQSELDDSRQGDSYGLSSKTGDKYRKLGSANSWTCTEWDSDAGGEVEGACARLVTGDGCTTDGHAQAIALEVIGKGNSTNGWKMTGNARWDQTLLKPVDLTQVKALTEALALPVQPKP